jgi:hypothetical protein
MPLITGTLTIALRNTVPKSDSTQRIQQTHGMRLLVALYCKEHGCACWRCLPVVLQAAVVSLAVRCMIPRVSQKVSAVDYLRLHRSVWLWLSGFLNVENSSNMNEVRLQTNIFQAGATSCGTFMSLLFYSGRCCCSSMHSAHLFTQQTRASGGR